ncbi:MAG: DMT family transporter [Candidatus Hodarchaeales archaeon]|jgi:drug/metabolite transporter (DMT)-like permease
MHSSIKKFDPDFIFKAFIIVILWATPPLVSKLWVGSKGVFPGLYFGFLRYIFGAFALLFIIGLNRTLGNLTQLLKNHLKPILFCSSWLVLMIIGQNFSILFILGASSSVLLNFNPVLIYLFAPFLFVDEKYSSKKTLGFIVSLIGIGFVFLASLETNTVVPSDFIIGYGLGFLSGVAWAGYSLSLKQYFQESQSQEVTALNLLVAAIILLVFSMITEPLPTIESYTVESIWGLVVIGIGAAAVAFTLYLQLVQKYGATRAGNIQFLIPLVSLVFAFIFLNEFSIYTLVGGIFCAIGVAMVNYEGSG